MTRARQVLHTVSRQDALPTQIRVQSVSCWLTQVIFGGAVSSCETQISSRHLQLVSHGLNLEKLESYQQQQQS